MTRVATITLIASLMLSACGKDEPVAPNPMQETPIALDIPEGFPPMVVPADNALTVERVALGKRLFYDPILSADGRVSCASCHKPELAFADDKPVSPGVHGRLGMRNAPSLANVAYVGRFNKDGGVPKLDLQAAVPMEDANEMDQTMAASAALVNADVTYFNAFMLAYGRPADAFTLTRALGAFQRILLSGDSPYDHFLRGDTQALSEAQLRGRALFFSEQAQCSQCHSGHLLGSDEFINNGVLLDYGIDPGRRRVTGLPEDEGKFRVPSLRNVAVTAPYMHNGSLPTLQAVLEHYNQGGQPHPQKDARIRPLKLSPTDIADLIAFLGAFTDERFLTNGAYR